MNLKFTPLNIKNLQQSLNILPMFGLVKIDGNFSYLDIDDNFIHKIFPLINNRRIKKPDYFNETTRFIGAHISITYPEEATKISEDELEKTISFSVDGLFSAFFLEKQYYVLKVRSNELLKIRSKYNLSNKLKFKNHWIDPHITIAVKE